MKETKCTKVRHKNPKNQQVQKTGSMYSNQGSGATLGVLGYPLNNMIYTG